MRRAVIDLGTNTFNLLIADNIEGKLVTVHSDKRAVLLGMDGINEGRIAEPAMERAKDALKFFSSSCLIRQTDMIIGIGTSALRAASNSEELLIYASEELNISIEIISGQREAELIYYGVRLTYPFSESAVIMDIGGGSTEFISANSSGIERVTSLDIGVSRIFQVMNKPEEFTSDHISEVLSFLEGEACGFFKDVKSNVLIGSSGSFETLYSLVFEKEFPDSNESLEIPMAEVLRELNWIINSSLEDRKNNPWIVPIRKKMLPISAVKMKWVIEKLGIEQLFVSPYSLKEGVFSNKEQS
jgi:exopolyphosphatase / guanosine-5'-triphosphate,3'-diphosphate pyrophosphatase